MLLRIIHQTKLKYSAEVSGTIFEARMAPRSDEDQTSLAYSLTSSPTAPLTSYRDGDGNRIDLFNISQPYTSLSVTATSHVRTHRRDGYTRLKTESLTQFNAGTLSMELGELLKASPLVPFSANMAEFAASIDWPADEMATARAERLMHAVGDRLTYAPAVTHAWSSAEEVLEHNSGVCQDFAHILIGLARLKGLPARYVSGYIYQPGQIATHAWAQVWFGPMAGWIDIDPTRSGFATNDHVTVAFGRDYSDVPPNRGVWSGMASESIDVAVEITEVDRLPSDFNGFTPRKQAQRTNQATRSPGAQADRSQASSTYGFTGTSRGLARQPFQPTSHPQQTQQQQQRATIELK